MFSLLGGPWLLYIKIALVTAILGGVAFASWHVRALIAARDQDKAVSTAVTNVVEVLQSRLAEERKLRQHFETVANNGVDALMKSISTLRKNYAVLGQSLAKERASNPSFYLQPLPEAGYEQWKKARALFGPSAAASSPP